MKRSKLPKFAHAIAALAIVMPGCDAAFASPLGKPVAISCHLASKPLSTAASATTAASTAAPQDAGARIASQLAARGTVLHPLLDCRIVEAEDEPVPAPRRMSVSTTASQRAAKDVAAR